MEGGGWSQGIQVIESVRRTDPQGCLPGVWLEQLGIWAEGAKSGNIERAADFWDKDYEFIWTCCLPTQLLACLRVAKAIFFLSSPDVLKFIWIPLSQLPPSTHTHT